MTLMSVFFPGWCPCGSWESAHFPECRPILAQQPLSAPTKQLLFSQLQHVLGRRQTSVYSPYGLPRSESGTNLIHKTSSPSCRNHTSKHPEWLPWSPSLGNLEAAHPVPEQRVAWETSAYNSSLKRSLSTNFS